MLSHPVAVNKSTQTGHPVYQKSALNTVHQSWQWSECIIFQKRSNQERLNYQSVLGRKQPLGSSEPD